MVVENQTEGGLGGATGSVIRSKFGSQLFIDMSAMADGYEANHPRLAVDRVDDSKSANAKLPQSVEFAKQWLAAFRVGGDGANRRLDGSFQIGVE